MRKNYFEIVTFIDGVGLNELSAVQHPATYQRHFGRSLDK